MEQITNRLKQDCEYGDLVLVVLFEFHDDAVQKEGSDARGYETDVIFWYLRCPPVSAAGGIGARFYLLFAHHHCSLVVLCRTFRSLCPPCLGSMLHRLMLSSAILELL